MSQQIFLGQFNTHCKDAERNRHTHDLEGDFVGDMTARCPGVVPTPSGWIEEVQSCRPDDDTEQGSNGRFSEVEFLFDEEGEDAKLSQAHMTQVSKTSPRDACKRLRAAHTHNHDEEAQTDVDEMDRRDLKRLEGTRVHLFDLLRLHRGGQWWRRRLLLEMPRLDPSVRG